MPCTMPPRPCKKLSSVTSRMIRRIDVPSGTAHLPELHRIGLAALADRTEGYERAGRHRLTVSDLVLLHFIGQQGESRKSSRKCRFADFFSMVPIL